MLAPHQNLAVHPRPGSFWTNMWELEVERTYIKIASCLQCNQKQSAELALQKSRHSKAEATAFIDCETLLETLGEDDKIMVGM